MNRDELKGITPRKCPEACTQERCVISTVGVCKHPSFTSDSGCGPITMANRELARKVVKINLIEGDGDAQRESGAARLRGDVEDGGGAKKAPRARKKANAGRRGKRVPARRSGAKDQPPGETRQEEGMTNGEEALDIWRNQASGS
jgi:hypothetical protein